MFGQVKPNYSEVAWRVTEPNYSDFAFSPKLLQQAPGVTLERIYVSPQNPEQMTLSEQRVQSLITSSLIVSPVYFKRPDFAAPYP